MKKLQILFILLLVISAQQNLHSQNYFPLHVGNQWEYPTKYSTKYSHSYGLDTIVVKKDSTLDNKTYYRLSSFPDDWLRYSEKDQKVYLFYQDSEYVFIDFTLEEGAKYQQFQPKTHIFQEVTVIKKENRVGYDYYWGNRVHSTRFYSKDTGLVYSEDYEYNIGPTGGDVSISREKLSVIEGIIYDSMDTPHYIGNDAYPEINFSPVISTSDSLVDFEATVNHPYSFDIFNFINKVYLTGYYSKGENSKFDTVQIPLNQVFETKDYNARAKINIILLKNGYSFYYKITAEDLGIFQHEISSPDTGFYILKYDSSFQIKQKNFFPLSVGNKWLYKKDWVYAAYWLENVSIVADTIINNKKYYRFFDSSHNTPMKNGNWTRYDSENQIVYEYYLGSDHPKFDFFKAIDLDVNILGKTVEAKAFGDKGPRFAENLGFIKEPYIYPDFPVAYSGNSLIQAIIYDSANVPHYYDNNQFPNLSLISAQTVNDSFYINFWGKHFYSEEDNDFFEGYMNFIDSVKLISFYFNGANKTEIEEDSIGNLKKSFQYSYRKKLNLNYLENGYKFYYRLVAKDKGIIPHYASLPDTGFYVLDFDPSTVGFTKEKNLPLKFSVSQNYPNPFNPLTTIEYSVAKTEFVNLKIYDILGNEVAMLINEEKSPGNYKVEFDGSKFSSGVYIYKLTAGGFSKNKKMILMK